MGLSMFKTIFRGSISLAAVAASSAASADEAASAHAVAADGDSIIVTATRAPLTLDEIPEPFGPRNRVQFSGPRLAPSAAAAATATTARTDACAARVSTSTTASSHPRGASAERAAPFP